MGWFCEYLKQNTDIHDPRMIGIMKETDSWMDDDEALWHAIERGDDPEARRLVVKLGLLGDMELEEAEEWRETIEDGMRRDQG